MSEKAGFGILIHIQSLQHFQITYPSFHRWWWYFGFHSLKQNIRHTFSCGAEINTKDDEYKICKEIRNTIQTFCHLCIFIFCRNASYRIQVSLTY